MGRVRNWQRNNHLLYLGRLNMSYKILILDDNRDDRDIIAREVERALPDARIQAISNSQQYAAITDNDIRELDAALVDYKLHWSDGLSILRRIRSVSQNCAVIMVTGTGNEEVAVEAMKSGLDDYIVKNSSHWSRIPVALQNAITHRNTVFRLQEVEDGLLKHKVALEKANSILRVVSALSSELIGLGGQSLYDILETVGIALDLDVISICHSATEDSKEILSWRRGISKEQPEVSPCSSGGECMTKHRYCGPSDKVPPCMSVVARPMGTVILVPVDIRYDHATVMFGRKTQEQWSAAEVDAISALARLIAIVERSARQEKELETFIRETVK